MNDDTSEPGPVEGGSPAVSGGERPPVRSDSGGAVRQADSAADPEPGDEAKAPLRYDVAGRSEAGNVRRRNEDAWGVRELGGGTLIVVADGMGRHGGGDVASRIAVDEVIGRFDAAALGHPDQAEAIPDALADAMAGAHEALQKRADEEPALSSMGTTVQAVLVTPAGAYHQYAGDSPLLLVRGGEVVHRTRDHSVAQVLVALGRIQPEEAPSHPMAARLTSYLGANAPWDNVEISPPPSEPAFLALQPGDVALLCTDGVTGSLDAPAIARLLDQGGTARDKVDRLLDAVLAGEATDNATAVVAVAAVSLARTSAGDTGEGAGDAER